MNPYDFYITPEEYEQAIQNGVDAFTLERRIRQLGWSKERAMTTPIRKQKPRGFYSEWAKIAEENGIGYKTFMRRIHYGWPVEKAATQPLASKEDLKRLALHAGKYARRVHPKKYIELAKQNNIPYPTFHYRVKVAGWSYERAATEPIWTPQQRGKLGAPAAARRWIAGIRRQRL